MNKKARNGLIITAVTGMALTSVLGVSGGLVALAEENTQNNLYECQQLLQTVHNDLSSIVSGYNRVYETDWQASEIEYSTTVYLLNVDEYGVYLDLDGNNGYIVMSTDHKIYGVETVGDLEYLRYESNIYYDSTDGFMYEYGETYRKYSDDIEVLRDEIIGSPAPLNNENQVATISSIAYPGQDEPGDGKINPAEIEEYVAARYPNYTFVGKNTDLQSGYKCSTQRRVSYYIKDYGTTIGTTSEGNCSLNAMYNVMYNLSKIDYLPLPYTKTVDIRSSILTDCLYSVYGSGTCNGKDSRGSYRWEVSANSYALSHMPQLYIDIRSYAVSQCGYTVNGYSIKYIPQTFKYVAETLYDIDVWPQTSTAVSSTIRMIDHDRTLYMSVLGSETYGNHGVAIIGYYVYTNSTDITDVYSVSDNKYFYLIADGWDTVPKVFDPNVVDNIDINFFYLSRC